MLSMCTTTCTYIQSSSSSPTHTTMASIISSHLIKKNITHPAIYSLTGTPKTPTLPPPFAAVKLAETPPEISLKTPRAHEFSVPKEVPRTPNVPDFDPIPPEKPADPPPLPPDPAPEFPGPPIPDPGIQPPGPDMPVPPSTPGGPEVVPPRTPEWMPPGPPGVGPQPITPPEISLPYTELV